MGAAGGRYGGGNGGLGGYSVGNISLTSGTTLYVYVGGQGSWSNSSVTIPGGYNGGGDSWGVDSSSIGASGGGATDIRINNTSLYARVIVAGGGGGTGYYVSSGTYGTGGYGGGSTGRFWNI